MGKKDKTASMEMMNWRLEISYRGTAYCGWQRQNKSELISVQEVVEEVLWQVFNRSDVIINGSGRTDAGVHALRQTASFETLCHKSWTEERLFRVLNHQLPSDVRVVTVQRWPMDLHARFSATSKNYCYVLNLRKDVNPFMEDLTFRTTYDFDLAKVKESAEVLLGTHDFTAFAAKKKLAKLKFSDSQPQERRVYRSPDKPKGNIRTIYDIKIKEVDGLVFMTFTGSGFLYKMVRSLVGHLLWVGSGRCKVEDTKKVLEGAVRSTLVETAPARGLYLGKVFYEDEDWQDYDFIKDPLFPSGIINSYPRK